MMRTALLGLLLLALPASASDEEEAAAPPAKLADRLQPSSYFADAGWQEHKLRSGGLDRWYRIYRPAKLQQPAPVVMVLHGGFGSMRSLFAPRSGGNNAWPALADQAGFILLVPNGSDPDNGDTQGDMQHWNDLRPELPGRLKDVDDVRFINELLDTLEGRLPIDSQRVYLSGISNGGMLAYRLLLETPKRFAAASVFSAGLPTEDSVLPRPKLPTPLMIAHGTEDPVIKWEGGMIAGQRGSVRPVEETMLWWLHANRAIKMGPQKRKLPDLNPDDRCQIEETRYPASRDGAPLLFYRIEGGGHSMPNPNYRKVQRPLVKRVIGPTCRDADGVVLAWEFMREFSRKAP